jgi:hypothetical protein
MFQIIMRSLHRGHKVNVSGRLNIFSLVLTDFEYMSLGIYVSGIYAKKLTTKLCHQLVLSVSFSRGTEAFKGR